MCGFISKLELEFYSTFAKSSLLIHQKSTNVMLGSKLLKTMQMSAILLLLPQTYTIWISNAFLSIPKRAKYSASRISSNHRQSVVATTSFSARSDATDVIDDSTTTTPTKKRLLDPNQLSALDNDGYIVISDFISAVFQEDLRKDIMGLRRKGKFTVAKVGTNNDGEEEVRNAEICLWLHEEPPAPLVRQALYRLLIDLMKELEELSHETLTAEELSYLYYPKGGYFRRHVDSMPNTNVEYRTYSLLIYLNDHWMKSLGGQLRIHL